MRTYVLLLVAVGACTIEPREYTGATIRAQLTNNGVRSVQDTTTMPSFPLGTTDTDYSIEIQIFTQQGTASTGGRTDSSHVTNVSTTFALGDMALPSPELEREASAISPDFTSKAPLAIPGIAKGGTLVFHAVGEDNNGLSSNIIDMEIELK